MGEFVFFFPVILKLNLVKHFPDSSTLLTWSLLSGCHMELLMPIVLHTLHISLQISVPSHAKGDVLLENALSQLSCHGEAGAPLAVGHLLPCGEQQEGRQVSTRPTPCRR